MIPPVGPTGIPACEASSETGRPPTASTTRSAGIDCPPAVTPVTLSVPSIRSTITDVRTRTPLCVMASETFNPRSASSVLAITEGSASTMTTSQPLVSKASATSMPMYPAPMTTSLPLPAAAMDLNAAASVRVRNVWTPGRSTPCMGGMNARAPVAMRSLSNPVSDVDPSAWDKVLTVRRSRSILVTSVRSLRSIPALANWSGVRAIRSLSSSTSPDTKYGSPHAA